MRAFDKLSKQAKTEILNTAIAYAKADGAEDVIKYAVGFGEMFLLKESDFKGLKPESIKTFTGDRPVWRKIRW